jgi:hypothetical protein
MASKKSAADIREYARLLRTATDSCMAAEASPHGRLQKNVAGYAAYVALVRKQIADGSFANTAATMQPFLPMTLHALFCNNLSALSSCVSHELMPPEHAAPLVEALQEAFAACTASAHNEGLVTSAFGLGFHNWNSGDRPMAIEFYGAGVKAGADAKAKGEALGISAQHALGSCAANLAEMSGRGSGRGGGGGGGDGAEAAAALAALQAIGGSSFVKTRVFATGGAPLPAPKLGCDGPGCDVAIALERCSGCLSARYCGTDCQKKGWPAHKAACKKAQRERAGGGK